MSTIHGYVVDDNKWEVRGGNGQCNTAVKNGVTYFIKRMNSPKYPVSDHFDADYRRAKIAECDEWLRYRKRIAAALPGTGSGNIIKPLEYFREGPFFYEVTNLVDVDSIPYEEIWKESKQEKARLMMTVAMSLSQMHNCGIVHGDLDPGNILISRSKNGHLITKMIDFTDAFFRMEIPDAIMSKDAWWSPEVAVYTKLKDQKKLDWRKQITTKADIFSLGLIFHQYCTKGAVFPKHSGNYPWNELIKGGVLKADSSIEPEFQELINSMLALEPDDRPEMAEIHQKLRDIAEGKKPEPPVTPPTPPKPEPVKKTGEVQPGPKKSSAGKSVVSAQRHEKNPKKVVLKYDDGTQQIMDFNLAKNLGLIKVD